MRRLSMICILLAVMFLFGFRPDSSPSKYTLHDSAQAATTPTTVAQECDSLGTIWVVGEVVDYASPTSWAWNGRWVRRGSSNIFDAIWIHRSGQKVVTPVTITIQGNQVYIDRPNCQYTGTLVGSGVNGTYRCAGAGVNYWSANIGCELGEGACGLGTEWRVNDAIVPGVTNPGWVSVWTRQGTSNVFKSKAVRQGEPDTYATHAITIEGNKVYVERKDEPNKFLVTDCVYEGFLIGKGGAATGTATCNSGVGKLGPVFWDARILCGGGNQGPPPPGQPPGRGQPPGGGGGTPIDWNTNPAVHRGENGKRFTYSCPSAPNASEIRGVYGTDVYLDDSGICLAAVHAGLITSAGGTVTVEIRPGQASYVGSTLNGVTTSTSGQYPGSFIFVGGAGQYQRTNLTGIQVVSGTYGANCRVAEGNMTSQLASACNGKMRCDYAVNVTVLGDPAHNCSKNYVAKWRCGNDPRVNTATVEPEAGYGRTASLSCER